MIRFRNAFGVPLVAAIVWLSSSPLAQTTPGTPTNVTAAVSGTNLNVSWTAPPGTPAPTAYRLDFRLGTTVVASLTVGATTSVSIPIPPGTTGTFSVTVTAIAGSTAGSPSSPTTFTIGGGGCTPPDPPSRIVGMVSNNFAIFSWNFVQGATSYGVQAGTTPGSSNIFNGVLVGDAVSGALPPGLNVFLSVGARNTCGGGVMTHPLQLPPLNTCANDANTHCIIGNRFLFNVNTRQPGSNTLTRIPVDGRFSDGGLFSLSVGNNHTDLLVRVLNSCNVNNRYWVFASGLTNVETSITVTDTQRGTTRQYFNPQGRAFQPIQDTSAFATCP